MQNPNIDNRGKNNKFVLILQDGSEVYNPYIEGLKILFLGNNNVIKLYAPVPKFLNSRIEMQRDAEFILKESKYHIFNLIVWKMRAHSRITIGKNFSCQGVEFSMHGEDGLIVNIGDECMFSHDISIQPTDSHAIIDRVNYKPINYGGNINIGNHVWICPYARVHKNVSIADGCVLGVSSYAIKSLVTPNSVNVGIPAKAIKTNIAWSRKSAPDFIKDGDKICY